MVSIKLLFILLTSCVFLNTVTATTLTRYEQEQNEKFNSHIQAVVDYLNSDVNKIYEYKRGNFVSAEQKADVTEIVIDVDVICGDKYPEIICSENTVTCHAFLGPILGEDKYRVLSDVTCSPKIEISVENMDKLEVDPIVPQISETQSNIELSHEDVSREQEADFVAYRRDNVPCLGCPFDLSTDAEGVDELVHSALSHVETERDQRHAVVKILRIQQQIVAGVKYILDVEITPTTCPKNADISQPCPPDSASSTSICHVVYIQKPWIDRKKHIINNNCTVSQEFTPITLRDTREDIDNEIPSNFNRFQSPNRPINDPNTLYYNTVADNGRLESHEQMTPARLADLESQILQGDEFVAPLDNDNAIVKATATPVSSSRHPAIFDPSLPFVEEIEPKTYTIEATTESATDDVEASTTTENTVEEQSNTDGSALEVDASTVAPLETVQQRISSESKSDESRSSESSEERKNDEKITSTKNEESSEEQTQPVNLLLNADEGQNVPETNVRVKRKDDDSSSSSSSSSEEDKKDKPKKKKDDESSDSDDSDNDNNKKRHRRDDSSSSSSSSSEEDKKDKPKKKKDDERSDSDDSDNDNNKKRHRRGDSSSSSSSSSSEEDDKDKPKKKNDDDSDDSNNDNHKKRNRRDDSSSSSSSSSDDEKKDNSKKKKDNNSSSSSSSSSSSEEDNGATKLPIVKRSVRQMEKISQDERSFVSDLANFAANTLDRLDEDNHKRVILQILGAKKLKLDGIYYQIILRLGISHCSEHEFDDSCREKLMTNLTKICKVQVYVDEDLANPKVVKSQCQNIKKDENDRNRTNYSRLRKRRRAVFVGGANDIPLDDPRVSEYTKESLEHLDAKSGKDNKHQIVEILGATSQVVAGVIYSITAKISLSDCTKSDPKPREECGLLTDATPKICKIEVWERLWLKQRETKIKCDDDTEYSFPSTTSRRRRRSLGAATQIPIMNHQTIAELRHMIQDTLDRYNAQHLTSNVSLYVSDILTVRKQTVNGLLWTVQAELLEKDRCVEVSLCQSDRKKMCQFKIWDKLWLIRQTNITCDDSVEQIVYTVVSRNVMKNDEKMIEKKSKQIANLAVDYINLKSTFNTRYIVQSINSFYAPINHDSNWHINANIARSDCIKKYNDANCVAIHSPISCDIMLSTKINKNLLNITCTDQSEMHHVFVPDLTDDLLDDHHKLGYVEENALLQGFTAFVKNYNKVYANKVEHNFRLKVFRDNLNTIRLLNKFEQGTARYGVTEFADLTEKEFSKMHGLRMRGRSPDNVHMQQAEIPEIDLPDSLDWRSKNAVTHVKDQGMCGSCWAFSVTGNVEGQYAIKHGNLLEFSEQELVDCDKTDDGCNGGYMYDAYKSIEKLGGLESESDYPYEGVDERCSFNKAKVEVQLTGALNISHNETDMAKWLVANGPISIAINANAMQFYMGGVSHPYKFLCSPKNLDHGVLIVGYGTDSFKLFNKTLPYWIVKNSWGTSWGEQGYYRVYRGDGTCGLNLMTSSAIVA